MESLLFVFFSPTAGSALPRRECYPFVIFNDSVTEGNETFEIVLSLDLSTRDVIVLPAVTEVTILDNNGEVKHCFLERN